MTQSPSTTSSVMSSVGFRRLVYSSSAVIFGVLGQAVARGWLARELTGSNTGLGGVMLAFGVAMLVSSPIGGVAADTLPKRAVLIASVAALGASSLLLGLVVVLGEPQYWMLLLASAVQASSFAFYLPARIALLPDVVALEQTGEAITVTQTVQEGMRVFAPALAGVLVGVSWFGSGGVFLTAAAMAVIAGVVLVGVPEGRPRRTSVRSPWSELVDAAGYVRARRHLVLLSLTTIGVVILAFPYMTFLPAIAEDRYAAGATGYGVMSGTAGLGAVVAGVAIPRWRAMAQRPWRLIAGSGLALAIGLVALGLAGSFAIALVALAVIGGAALVFQTTAQSLLLTLSDVEYHGRLQSMVVIGVSGFGLAALPLGMAADATSLHLVLVSMGVSVGVISLAFLVVRNRQRRGLVELAELV